MKKADQRIINRRGRSIAGAFALSAVLAACGGGSKTLSENDFVDQLNGICKDVNRAVNKLDTPSDIAGFEDLAKEAGKLTEDGLADLNKLKPPSSLSKDFDDFKASIQDTLDETDKLAAAAKDEDEDKLNASLKKLSGYNDDRNKIADDLGADDCIDESTTDTTPDTSPDTAVETVPDTEVDTVPETDAPTTTEADTVPETDAPTTTEVETVPSTDVIVETMPSESTPASTNKTVIPLSATLAAQPGLTFEDLEDSQVQSFISILDTATSIAPLSGAAGGTGVRDASGVLIANIYTFVADATIPPEGGAQFNDVFKQVFAPDSSPTPTNYGNVSGFAFSNGERQFFSTINGSAAIFVIGVDDAKTNTAVTAFFNALG